jgi:hypothetical protein
MTTTRTLTIAILAASVLTSMQPAIRYGSHPIPLERIIANASRALETSPKDANTWVVLGRTHAYAFFAAVDYMHMGASDEADWLRDPVRTPREEVFGSSPLWSKWRKDQTMAEQDPARRLDHLKEALECLHTALDLQPENALAHLSLGFVFEHGAHLSAIDQRGFGLVPADASPIVPTRLQETREQVFAGRLRMPSGPTLAEIESWCVSELAGLDFCRADSDAFIQRRAVELLETCWRRLALAHYVEAFRLAESSAGANAAASPAPSLPTLRHEAASSAARLAEIEGFEALAKEQRGNVERIEAGESDRPRRPVSPLVFAMSEGGCEDLLDDRAQVCMDLDSDGNVEGWSWVRPHACILVWLPAIEQGPVSGNCLFGQATWNLFPPNGFAALALLDDDGDGFVSAGEMRDIGVWQDANLDGAIEAAEVRPAATHGVTAFAVEPHLTSARALTLTRGVQLDGGRWLPLYDVFFLPKPRSE